MGRTLTSRLKSPATNESMDFEEEDLELGDDENLGIMEQTEYDSIKRTTGGLHLLDALNSDNSVFNFTIDAYNDKVYFKKVEKV